jgi:Domain of unknown function (DUF1931)
VAEVDVDKDDLKRFSGFVFERTIDLLIRAQADAKANLRDTIELWVLPITKGLQERIHEFERLDRDIGLEPFPAELVAHPPLDVTLSDETHARLPSVAGGLSVALGRAFKIVDPKLVNPSPSTGSARSRSSSCSSDSAQEAVARQLPTGAVS